MNTAAKGFFIGGGITAGVQFSAGCAVGAWGGAALLGIATLIIGGEGAFGGAPVGCVTGGVSAVLDGLPQSVITGGIGAVVGYRSEMSGAALTLNNDLKVCSTIP